MWERAEVAETFLIVVTALHGPRCFIHEQPTIKVQHHAVTRAESAKGVGVGEDSDGLVGLELVGEWVNALLAYGEQPLNVAMRFLEHHVVPVPPGVDFAEEETVGEARDEVLEELLVVRKGYIQWAG